MKFVNKICYHNLLIKFVTTIGYCNWLIKFVDKICYYSLLIQFDLMLFVNTFFKYNSFFLVRSDVQIIRSCGHEKYTNLAGEPKDEYTTVLEEYNTFVTTCTGDK